MHIMSVSIITQTNIKVTHFIFILCEFHDILTTGSVGKLKHWIQIQKLLIASVKKFYKILMINYCFATCYSIKYLKLAVKKICKKNNLPTESIPKD